MLAASYVRPPTVVSRRYAQELRWEYIGRVSTVATGQPPIANPDLANKSQPQYVGVLRPTAPSYSYLDTDGSR